MLFQVSRVLWDILGDVCQPFYFGPLRLDHGASTRKAMKVWPILTSIMYRLWKHLQPRALLINRAFRFFCVSRSNSYQPIMSFSRHLGLWLMYSHMSVKMTKACVMTIWHRYIYIKQVSAYSKCRSTSHKATLWLTYYLIFDLVEYVCLTVSLSVSLVSLCSSILLFSRSASE